MPARQLHLFEPARPLLERFGNGFFRAVPPGPGVYIMTGENGCVLYIGQSRNLRRRLGSYKNARPDRAPRKIIRLIHSVRSLVWEECPTEQAARLKETQLLRTHRPRFNRQNTFPTGRFISLGRRADALVLRLTREPKPDDETFGAFKAGATRAFAALLRLLWAALHRPASPQEFPAPLLRERPPLEFQLAPSPFWLELPALADDLGRLLAGESDALLAAIATALPTGPEIPAFQRNLLAADLEALTAFYQHGPKRNRALRLEHGLADNVIAPETLDDLLVLGASAHEAE